MNPYVTIISKAQFPPSTNGQSLFTTKMGWSKLPYNYGTLYVPKGCAQYYRAQTRWEWCEIGDCPIDTEEPNDWSKFQNIVELDY